LKKGTGFLLINQATFLEMIVKAKVSLRAQRGNDIIKALQNY
jgi:hypothetical protein